MARNTNFKKQVSIITSIYDDLEGLMKTGESIMAQTYPVEWIVVDSDSGPQVRKYLANVKSDFHSIRWISEKDRGLYDGMNKGFALSTGEIILFLNAADTLADVDTVQKVVKSYFEDRWSWAVGLAIRLNLNGEPRMVWEYYLPTLGGLALGTRTFCHQATYYTREILENIMPYDINNLAADHLLNIKAFKRAKPKMLTFVTCFFMDGGISSQRPMRAAFKDLRRIRIQEDILLLNSKLIDFILTNLAILLIKAGSITWRGLRSLSHGFVKENNRVIYDNFVSDRDSDRNATNRS